jgi:hypothetical protein
MDSVADIDSSASLLRTPMVESPTRLKNVVAEVFKSHESAHCRPLTARPAVGQPRADQPTAM